MNIPKDYQRVEGSMRKPVKGARRIGDVDPNETMSVTILVRRRPDAEALPDPVAMASAPIGEQKFTSREEYAKRFGAAPEDLKLVEGFARARSLTVVESSAAKRIVTLSGTAGQMSSAFAVKLGRYKSPDETYRGREGHVHVPKEVAHVIEGVFGLDNRRMAKRGATSAGVSSLTPPQVAKLYNFPTSQNGSGQTIGIIEFGGGYKKSDIDAFFNSLGLTSPQLTDVSVLGATNSPGSQADTEVILDIAVAGGVAPGAHIVVYFAPWTEQGWINVITTAINDTTNKPSVLSLSWGYAEGKGTGGVTWTAQAISAVSSAFYDATQLGVTVFAASGDWGSSSGWTGGKALAWYPTTDPYVTACGGTTIKNVSGASFTETTWPDTGGGISDVFPLPSWQQGIGVPPSANDGHIGRGIPDVAGNADPSSGYMLTINGKNSVWGGTSAVSPLYAGLIALINANLANPVGYLNPRLYGYGTSPSLGVFRDMADGVSNASNNAPGYTSGSGWDACTGWGSINGTALLNALKPVVCIAGMPKSICPAGKPMITCVAGKPSTPLCVAGKPDNPCLAGKPKIACVAGKQILVCVAGEPTKSCTAGKPTNCLAGKPYFPQSRPRQKKPAGRASSKPTVKRKPTR